MRIKLNKITINQLLTFTILIALVLVGTKTCYPQNNGSLIVSPGEDYLLGLNDIVEIKIEDAPELSGSFRIFANGTLILPVIGQIAAEKKRTYEIAQAITDKLKGNYLMNPIVSVSLKQSNSRAYFIQGAVRTPGIYQAEGRVSLLKLITIAGGLNEKYGSTAYVMREKKPAIGEITSIKDVDVTGIKQENPDTAKDNQNTTTAQNKDVDTEGEDKYEIIKANINNLLRGNLDQNVMINPGDIVHIPQADIYFVAGEVKAPGSFTLKEGTTLRQAISMAQGTNFEADSEKGVIFREDQTTGRRDEISINVKAIMSGKSADVDILPNDVIILPNSQKKAIAKGIMKGLAGGIPTIVLRALGF